MHRLTGTHARGATLAGLGLSLALTTSFLFPVHALARDTQASITINQQGNAQSSYRAYAVFRADVSADNKATHVRWASADAKDTVLAFLKNEGYQAWITEKGLDVAQGERAQNALEYIAQQIDDSALAESAETTPDTTKASSFAQRLARYLATSNAAYVEAHSGREFSGEEGYWLFVSNPESLKDGMAGTAPLWIALGGSVTAVNEKSSMPTVKKEVQEDSSGSWGRAADAQIGQAVSYRIIGTLPNNFEAFDHYRFSFEDHLSAGLKLRQEANGTLADAITVTVGKEKIPLDGTNASVTCKDNTLVIDFADLTSDFWEPYHLTGGTAITATYQAELTDEAKAGTEGNENTVVAHYTHDPITGGNGTTTPPPAPKLFTYILSLKKVDEQTNEPLSGAAFTIQVASENTGEASHESYVQDDGTLGATPFEFVTDGNGQISVRGIDEGSYVISEVTPPSGYEPLDQDIRVDVRSELNDEQASLDGLVVEVSGGDRVDAEATSQTGLASIDTDSGIITINATNDKVLDLPLTGLGGTNPALGAAAATVVGTILLIRSHRRR